MNVFDDIWFHLFNHHHDIDIPPRSEQYGSTWVDLPNSLFDPESGNALYQRYTRELLLRRAARLRRDRAQRAPQHDLQHDAGGQDQSRVHGALTTRVKLLVAGTPINLSWPSRVAEEYAMPDVLSGGRMEYGFPLGTGMEYWSNATALNPATARARFREGLDIIFRAWQEDGPTAEHHRLIVPLHPAFGASADDPTVEDIHDYRRHYLDLFDRLGLGRTPLVGHPMDGWLATHFASDHPEAVTRLVLGSPLGLRVPERPTVDLFTVPPAELGGYLTADPSLFAGVPEPPTPELLTEQYREMTSAARLLWRSPYDRRLARWLHRITMPTLLLRGTADRLIPVGQCAEWARRIPRAESRLLAGVGHLLFDESAEAVEAVASFAARDIRVPGAQAP